MLTLSEIKQEVDRLAAQIGASGYVFPTYGRADDGARPHIEVDSRGYHYVNVERGQEFKRITTGELNELLYHVFEAVTFSLASDYELKHRVDSEDFRRRLFQRQIEILSLLREEWSNREARSHEQILTEYPFDDFADTRAKLTAQVGWNAACIRYPRPGNPKYNSK
jgi:Immunity protein 63